jgi:signal transduction histidine kinase
MNNSSFFKYTNLQYQAFVKFSNGIRELSSKNTSFKSKLDMIAKLVSQATFSDLASIWIWHENQGMLKLQSSYGYGLKDISPSNEQAFFYKNEIVNGKDIVDRTPVIIPDIMELGPNEIKHKSQLLKLDIKSFVALPILYSSSSQFLGIINLMYKDMITKNGSITAYFKLISDQVCLLLFEILNENSKIRSKIAHETQAMMIGISGQIIRLSRLIQDRISIDYKSTKELNKARRLLSENDDSDEQILQIIDSSIERLSKFPHNHIERVMKDITNRCDQVIGNIANIEKKFDIGFLVSELTSEENQKSLAKYNKDQKELTILSLILDILYRNRRVMRSKKLYLEDIQFRDLRDIENKFLSISSIKIWTNEENFELIFQNVLGNAIKYSYEKRILKIGLSVYEDSIIIKIINKSIPIPSKYMQIIWEPGYRTVDEDFWPDNFKKPKGEGLGLNIASEIASLYQGEIYLDYSRKIGKDDQYGDEYETCFGILFPLEITKENIFQKKLSGAINDY